MKRASLKEWTYEEFMSLPEGGPFRYEIIGGEFCMTPSPSPRHQKISGNLFRIISNFLCKDPVGEIYAAPCDVVISKDPLQVVEPDLVFVPKEHASIITEKNIQGVPDLLVEILSPTTETVDRRAKFTLYERFGVPEYWIVDPEWNTVLIFRLVDGHSASSLEFGLEDKVETPLLPGLSISLSEVFPPEHLPA